MSCSGLRSAWAVSVSSTLVLLMSTSSFVTLGCASSHSPCTAEEQCAVGPERSRVRCTGRDPAQELELRFEGSDGFWFEGTLSLPERAWSERVPAVVLAHPAGAQSRDGIATGEWALPRRLELPVLAELARGLSERGFSVLRWDKRNCGRFNACADNDYPSFEGPVHVHDLARDITSALDALARVPGVDRQRVHLFGYAESAIFVPTVLRSHPEIASGVAFALEQRSLGRATLARADQLRELGSVTGMTEPDFDSLVARTRALGRDLTELAHFGAGGAARVEGRPDGFWVDALRFHQQNLSPAQWGRAGPILLLYGEQDETLPAPDVQAWERQIAAAKRSDRVLVLPCITHTLDCANASTPSVDPRVLDAAAAHFRGSRPATDSAPGLGDTAQSRTSCESLSAETRLTRPWGRPLERRISPQSDCVSQRGCTTRPIAICARGLEPHSLLDWAEDGTRRSFAARLGVRHGPITERGCDEECCNSSTGSLDLRELLHHEGVPFEFTSPLRNLCGGDDLGVCCPVPPHTKDGGGLVLATGTIAGQSLLDVELCRPLPEDYPMLDFSFGNPPLAELRRVPAYAGSPTASQQVRDSHVGRPGSAALR